MNYLELKECLYCKGVYHTHNKCMIINKFIYEINSLPSKEIAAWQILLEVKNPHPHYHKHYLAAFALSKYKDTYEKLMVLA